MQYIAHRVNTIERLRSTPTQFGVELDLRDRGDRLILQHDPFGDGEDFEEFLKYYRHGLLILNIKSERIEHRVLERVRGANVRDYFFLDCSFPMIRALIREGEHRIAVRFSEFEPVESALALAGQVSWVWVDCFSQMPLDARTHGLLKQHFKLCAVSPELQGRDVSAISDYAQQMAPFAVDAVCTKRPDLWQAAMSQLERKAA
jgi:hypothetical protein